MLIPVKDYAERYNKEPRTIRQMCAKGRFKSARKIADIWLIDETEPYPADHRKGNIE